MEENNVMQKKTESGPRVGLWIFGVQARSSHFRGLTTNERHTCCLQHDMTKNARHVLVTATAEWDNYSSYLMTEAEMSSGT